MKKLLILNGPNLNILHKREKDHYGFLTYDDLNSYILNNKNSKNFDITIKQSNHEGEIIDIIQNITHDYLIINPAGYTHTSVAILDSLLTLDIPIIEVHLSEVNNREEFRQNMITTNAATKVISGYKEDSYIKAIEYILHNL